MPLREEKLRTLSFVRKRKRKGGETSPLHAFVTTLSTTTLLHVGAHWWACIHLFRIKSPISNNVYIYLSSSPLSNMYPIFSLLVDPRSSWPPYLHILLSNNKAPSHLRILSDFTVYGSIDCSVSILPQLGRCKKVRWETCSLPRPHALGPLTHRMSLGMPIIYASLYLGVWRRANTAKRTCQFMIWDWECRCMRESLIFGSPTQWRFVVCLSGSWPRQKLESYSTSPYSAQYRWRKVAKL